MFPLKSLEVKMCRELQRLRAWTFLQHVQIAQVSWDIILWTLIFSRVGLVTAGGDKTLWEILSSGSDTMALTVCISITVLQLPLWATQCVEG